MKIKTPFKPFYTGQKVTNKFLLRWRSGRHVGAATPAAEVWVRRGKLTRAFRRPPEPQFGDILGGNGNQWYPIWVPHEDWRPLPGVRTIKLNQSYDNNGVAVATIDVDNTRLKPATGPGGDYHTIDRGYLTPGRGFKPTGRGSTGILPDEWHNELQNAQVLVKQGYGPDALVKTFTGLIDKGDGESRPDVMTLTSRDFGGVLLDQYFFGWAKDRSITDPITFVPRSYAERTVPAGVSARASSHEPGFNAENVLKKGTSDTWESVALTGHASDDDIQWIDIDLAYGRYSSIYLNPKYEGMETWIGIWCEPTGVKNPKLAKWATIGSLGSHFIGADMLQVEGHKGVNAIGWLDLGKGRVPGANGGWSFVRHFHSLPAKGQVVHLGGELKAGAGSRIRVGFRPVRTGEKQRQARVRRAGVRRLYANKGEWTDAALAAKKQGSSWILIDDVTEVVMVVLRWAGFQEWEVESSGVTLNTPYVVDKSKTFMDVVNEVKDMLGYVFFVAEPSDNDLSIGVPIFRQNAVLSNRHSAPTELKGSTLLTDLKPTFDNTEERYVIRARGAYLPHSKGGRFLGSDRVNRANFVYYPPWTGAMAGVIKQLTHYDPKYLTDTDCQFACYLIALQIALTRQAAVADAPGTPAIGLDSFAAITDKSTGVVSRLYVTNRQSTQTLTDASGGGGGGALVWVTELGGSLCDNSAIQKIQKDFVTASKTWDRNDTKREQEHQHPIKKVIQQRKSHNPGPVNPPREPED